MRVNANITVGRRDSFAHAQRETNARALKDYANAHGRDRDPRCLTQRPHRLDSLATAVATANDRERALNSCGGYFCADYERRSFRERYDALDD